VTKTSLIVSIALLSSFLVGCVATAPARLPFPPGPSLHGRMGTDGDEDFLCFGRLDAVALAQWMDKLEAFKHAYERGK
jgi:hypothetical protein